MAIDLKGIAAALVSRFGLDIKVVTNSKAAGSPIELSLLDLHQSEGFCVQVKLGWRSIEATAAFGSYSADLIKLMGRADPSQKASFVSLANRLRQAGADLKMQINSIAVQPFAPDGWPEVWNQLDLSLKRVPLLVERDNIEETRNQIVSWGGGLLGLLLSLLPMEDVDAEPLSELSSVGMPEGAKETIEVNRYERSRLNRALCIAAHGITCKVCGFNFEEFYGEIGTGFINVHHLVPVSRMGEGYSVNPVDDLVPLCANCHAMLHRFDPPATVEEVRNRIRR